MATEHEHNWRDIGGRKIRVCEDGHHVTQLYNIATESWHEYVAGGPLDDLHATIARLEAERDALMEEVRLERHSHLYLKKHLDLMGASAARMREQAIHEEGQDDDGYVYYGCGLCYATCVEGVPFTHRDTCALADPAPLEWLAARDKALLAGLELPCESCQGTGQVEGLMDLDGRTVHQGGECGDCNGMGVSELARLIEEAVEPYREAWEFIARNYVAIHDVLEVAGQVGETLALRRLRAALAGRAGTEGQP